jgi:hypothetical protein
MKQMFDKNGRLAEFLEAVIWWKHMVVRTECDRYPSKQLFFLKQVIITNMGHIWLFLSTKCKNWVFIGEVLSKVKVIFESLNMKVWSWKLFCLSYETNTSINNEVVVNFIWYKNLKVINFKFESYTLQAVWMLYLSFCAKINKFW